MNPNLEQFTLSAQQYFPNLKIKYKDESLFMKILGSLLFFNKSFMATYTTTIGSTIYFPSKKFVEERYYSSILILLHELVHVQDGIKFNPIIFAMLYLSPQIFGLLSVPLFFHPLPLTVFETEDYFVDGGVVDNYPIWIFNNIEALYQGELSNLNKEQINPLTLGLKLLGASNISQDYNRKPVESVFNFITQLINTMINQSNISSFSPSWIQQTILIPTGSIYFLNIDINNEKIEELLKHGTEAIQKHFKKE